MRLSAEKIKAAILSPDKDVRDAAVHYFSRSHSDDPAPMPLVIAACERYGLAAFEIYSFLSDLVQTEVSVGWIIQQIESVKTDDGRGESFLASCISGLRYADPAALKPHEATIANLKNVDDDAKEAIAHRLAASSFTPAELWQELHRFCALREQEEDAEKVNVQYGFALADFLARYPDACAQQALQYVTRKGEDWLEIMAVRMVGRLRLEAAIPALVDLTDDCEMWVFGEALNALTRIGTDKVVEEVVRRYPTANHGQRMTLAILLEDIHSDLSVQACIDLLGVEQDAELRRYLIQSLLMNFSSEGIEPARQHVLAQPKTPDLLELRHNLLVASKILDARFPEFDAWTEDSQNDAEFRREWYKDQPLTQLAQEIARRADDSWLDEETGEDGAGEFDENLEDVPPDTIVRHDHKVGRNDPCPCGSGKKYKKCCYGKEVRQPTASQADATGRTHAARSTAQFPIGTIALYGPDDKITTKIVAAVITRAGAEPVLQRWVGSNIKGSPKVRRQIQDFFNRHRVKSVAAPEHNLGCPHEEGPDFPVGEDCPFCPFWAGKQGSRAGNEE